VDFPTEPRRGDTFRIVVREEYLDGKRLGFGKILAAEYDGARASAKALRYVDGDAQLDWYDDDGHSVRRAFLKSPLNYRRITSTFTAHRFHPILKAVRPHWGVDYAAPVGTPVSALGKGVVVFAGRHGGYGNYIEVRHGSTYTTCYGHLSRFAHGLRRGTHVEQGDVIGYVGATGLATGPHLDFRVKRDGHFVDPLRLDSPPGRALSGEARARFDRYRDRAWELADRLAPDESVPEAVAWARVGPAAPAESIMAWEDDEGGTALAASR
jgi:murein DD-endopeptidase MepM/ murein hydrolase activator NlpD